MHIPYNEIENRLKVIFTTPTITTPTISQLSTHLIMSQANTPDPYEWGSDNEFEMIDTKAATSNTNFDNMLRCKTVQHLIKYVQKLKPSTMMEVFMSQLHIHTVSLTVFDTIRCTSYLLFLDNGFCVHCSIHYIQYKSQCIDSCIMICCNLYHDTIHHKVFGQ